MIKSKFLVALFSIILLTTFISASDYKIQNSSGYLFLKLDGTTGDLNITTGWIAENGIQLKDKYCALTGCAFSGGLNVTGNINITGTYYGDGSGLTGVSMTPNSTTFSYHNLTDIPICPSGQFLSYDGSNLACASVQDNSTNIAGENITSGTININRLPNMTNTHLHEYHNITGIPICSAGTSLSYNGTDLNCIALSLTFENIAFLNESQTFIEDNTFNKSLSINDSNLYLNNANITRYGSGTKITIDATGNVVITLG